MTLKLPIAEPPADDVATSPDDDARLLRVGDLAQRTQKTVRALHLYEELGLLQPSERSKGGYRLYASDAVVRVRWIGKLQEMGFSLPEIREVLVGFGSSHSAPGAMQRIRELYARKLEETRAQIARLEQLEGELEASIQYLDTCDTCAPSRLVNACPRCDLHHCDTPDLVAGLHGQRPA